MHTSSTLSPPPYRAYVNVLRAKYACTDNTVFRIKFPYYDTGFYHRQVWNMIDEKTAPLLNRVGVLQTPVNLVKKWFTGIAVTTGATGAAAAEEKKKE